MSEALYELFWGGSGQLLWMASQFDRFGVATGSIAGTISHYKHWESWQIRFGIAVPLPSVRLISVVILVQIPWTLVF